METPEDDYIRWDWELAATQPSRIGHGASYEAWVAPRPDGWYMIADHLTTPRGPYVTKAAAEAAARAALRDDQVW